MSTAAAFSPDGRRIVTASDDRTARIWDAATAKQLAVLSGHERLRHVGAAFSPDGRRIVTASDDKTARVWDAATARQLAVLAGHDESRPQSAAFSPDGRRIVTASGDQTARIWDAATGKPIAVLSGHGDWSCSAAFSPDGRRIVTGSDDKTARIWDADTASRSPYSPATTKPSAWPRSRPTGGGSSPRPWTRPAQSGTRPAACSSPCCRLGDYVGDAAFSPDGQRIAIAAAPKRPDRPHLGCGHGASRSPDSPAMRIWSAASRSRPTGGASSPRPTTGRRASGTRPAAFSSPSSPAMARAFAAEDEGGNVRSAAFSPDGRRIVTASNDKTARIWDAATGRQLAVLSGHDEPVRTAAFSPDGRRIVTASADQTARIWDAATAKPLDVLSGHADRVWSAAFSPDGRRIVTASHDQTARIWDADTAKQLAVLSGHSDTVWSAAWSPDGRRIVTASIDHTARIWDAAAARSSPSSPATAMASGRLHGRPMGGASSPLPRTRPCESGTRVSPRTWTRRLRGHRLRKSTTCPTSSDPGWACRRTCGSGPGLTMPPDAIRRLQHLTIPIVGRPVSRKEHLGQCCRRRLRAGNRRVRSRAATHLSTGSRIARKERSEGRAT